MPLMVRVDIQELVTHAATNVYTRPHLVNYSNHSILSIWQFTSSTRNQVTRSLSVYLSPLPLPSTGLLYLVINCTS